ncbi:hypothetical protein [Sporosarcina obsidiansis]|uniref:hypothetical protein n=1 Tax=Sporosarcina obsidiansis TaxID=2660748 RepID=UPI00129BCC62|nr:hypothetical protein [Sporosarcina obsidiansis]
MYSIGIRISPSTRSPKVYYAVINDQEDEFEIIRCSFLNIPLSLEIPEQLAFIRTNLLAIILQYNITHAGLRITETVARTPSVYRMNIEGVVQELFANSTIEKYSVMKIVQMSRLLETGDIKKYLEAAESFAGIEKWEEYKLEERECLVVACAATVL